MNLRDTIKKVLNEQDWTTNPKVSTNPNIKVNQPSNTQPSNPQPEPEFISIGWIDVDPILIRAYGIDAVEADYKKKGFSTKREGGQLKIRGGLPKSTYYSSPYKFGRGPQGHREVGTGTGWESLNAWDFMASPGTKVYSLTNGKVIKKRRPQTDNAYLWGDQITIQGIGGYPNVYYTHVTSPLSIGDEVSVGSLIGTIDTPKNGDLDLSHVHIGLQSGYDISSLLL